MRKQLCVYVLFAVLVCAGAAWVVRNMEAAYGVPVVWTSASTARFMVTVSTDAALVNQVSSLRAEWKSTTSTSWGLVGTIPNPAVGSSYSQVINGLVTGQSYEGRIVQTDLTGSELVIPATNHIERAAPLAVGVASGAFGK